MNSKFIYGTSRSFSVDFPVAVIFPEYVIHDELAKRLRMQVEAAGFVSYGISSDSDIVVHPYGESESIGVGIPEELIDNVKNALYRTLGIRAPL